MLVIGQVYALLIMRTTDFYQQLREPNVDAFVQLAAGDERSVVWVLVAVSLARAGRHAEARRVVERLLTSNLVGADARVAILLGLVTTAVATGDRGVAAVVSEWLAPAATLATPPLGFDCPARILGDAAALLGKTEQTRAYYLQALEVLGKIRHRPEIALTHLRLAELLLAEPPSVGSPPYQGGVRGGFATAREQPPPCMPARSSRRPTTSSARMSSWPRASRRRRGAARSWCRRW